MAQDFKSSMPIFQGIGQFGSLRSPEAGAPRYVGVKFNDNFRLLYKDFELTTPQYEEGEEIEPRFFLPIVPTVLLNGGSGIAVGFATNILNRNPLDLIDACIDVLDGKDIKVLKPWIRGFTGTFDVAPDNHKSWLIKGKYDIKNMSTVEITEVPPSFTYEKYEALLEGLVEKGTLHTYDDHTSGKIHYVLKFPRQTLADLIKKNKLEDVLKMQERETENYTTLDEYGKLKVFDTIAEMVSYFVKFRLSYYDKRKTRLLVDLQRDLDILEARSKFVDAVIKGRIVVANEKRPDLIKSIEKEGIQKQDDSYEFLLGMPIWTLTNEKFVDLQKKVDLKQKELDKIKKTAPEKMYRDDLASLRNQVVKEFTQ
jgi:DNA topoisomerase-2